MPKQSPIPQNRMQQLPPTRLLESTPSVPEGGVHVPTVSSGMLQRTVKQPGAARPSEIQALSQRYGNRATRSLLQTKPIQTKSKVGPAHDAFEQEADRMAERVVGGGTLQHAPSHLQRLGEGDGGFEVDSHFESLLSAKRGGGQPLPTSLRSDFESKFQSDFSGVRVHADSQSAKLNESIQARAFTTGQDIFFGDGEYQPHTTSGQKVLAHELTHVGQQNPHLGEHSTSQGGSSPSGSTIQPLRMNPKDKNYYSSVSPVFTPELMAKDKDDAFLTATSNSGGMRGGHTAVFVEYFEQDIPMVYQLDLFVNGAGSSARPKGVSSAPSGSTMEGSSTGKGSGSIDIREKELALTEVGEKLWEKGSGLKKTWKKKKTDAEAARKKAKEVAAKKSEYKYYLLGKGPGKLALNCARFGQAVLKAAGIPIHIGFWKLPDLITRPSKDDESIQVAPTVSTVALQSSSFPDSCKTHRAFMAATKFSDGRDLENMARIGRHLEWYHRYGDPHMKVGQLESVATEVQTFLKGRIRQDLENKTTTYATDPRVTFIRNDFFNAINTEATALKDEAEALIKLLSADTIGNAKQIHLTKEVAPRVKALMASLADIQRYTSASAMGNEKYAFWLEGHKAIKNKNLTLEQFLAQQGDGPLGAILDAKDPGPPPPGP